MLHLGSLDGDSLVHQGDEVGKIMHDKDEPEFCIESTAELLLLAGISGDLLFRVAREVEELTLVGFNSHVALSEVAEFFVLAIHDPLRNVAGTKSSPEFIPGNEFPNWK